MKLNHLRAHVWRMRHFLFALLAIAVLGAALETAASMRPATEAIVVAASDVAAGTTLEASDLAIEEVPAGLAPEGALADMGEAEGEILAASLPRGMPVPRQLLVSDAFFESAPKGHSIVPVAVASNAAADIIGPGDNVALYAPPAEGPSDAEATLVSENATVMGVSASEGSSSLFGGASEATLTFFVAVADDAAPRLLGASSRSALLVVARRQSLPKWGGTSSRRRRSLASRA